jgi:hypothetical protein
MARRSGSPVSSVGTTVPRCVVSATPTIEDFSTPGSCHSACVASPSARQ